MIAAVSGLAALQLDRTTRQVATGNLGYHGSCTAVAKLGERERQEKNQTESSKKAL